jgi:hypothetical protein
VLLSIWMLGTPWSGCISTPVGRAGRGGARRPSATNETSVVEARAALDGRRPAMPTNEEAMIDSQMDAVRLNRLGDGPG